MSFLPAALRAALLQPEQSCERPVAPAPVMDRFATGWPRRESPNPGDLVAFLTLAEVVSRDFPFDAHTVGYSNPEIPRRLALNDKPGDREPGDTDRLLWDHLHEVAPDGVRMVRPWFDVDAPDKRWTPEWWAIELSKIERLRADHPDVAVYTTWGGYRIKAGDLREPFLIRNAHDAARWSALCREWFRYFREHYEIAVDEACVDWQRFYRLPYVRRARKDGAVESTRPATIVVGDLLAVGIWDPPVAVPDVAPPPSRAEVDLPSWPENIDIPAAVSAARRRLQEHLDSGSTKCRPYLIRRVLSGEPFVGRDQVGDSHDGCHLTARKIACVVGTLCPDLSPAGAVELVRASVEAADEWSTESSGHYLQKIATEYEETVDLMAGREEAKRQERAELMELVAQRAGITPDAATPASNENAPPPEPEPGTWAHALFKAHQDLNAYRGTGTTNAGGKYTRPAFAPSVDLLDREFPPTPWMVQGLVTDKSVGSTSAEPKSIKTWVEFGLAVAVANGVPAFGEFETGDPRYVAIFCAEDDDRGARNRLRAVARGYGLDPREALKRIHIVCRQHLDLMSDPDLTWIIASIRSLPESPALTIFDPLRDVHAADENDSTGMSAVYARLRTIRDLCGCAVRTPHHSKKESSGRSDRGGQNMRGSGAIHGALDCGLYLSKLDTDQQSRWAVDCEVEIKAARGAGGFRLRLDVMDDRHGEAAKATWQVERSGGRSAEAARAAHDTETKLGEILAALDEARLTRGKESLGYNRLMKESGGGGKTIMDAALGLGEKRGLVEKHHRGKKAAGYRITDAGTAWLKDPPGAPTP